jgi:hypothetical protein
VLEGRDLLTQGGLGGIEAIRRRPERARLDDGLQRHDVPEFEAAPMIKIHDHMIPIPPWD